MKKEESDNRKTSTGLSIEENKRRWDLLMSLVAESMHETSMADAHDTLMCVHGNERVEKMTKSLDDELQKQYDKVESILDELMELLQIDETVIEEKRVRVANI